MSETREADARRAAQSLQERMGLPIVAEEGLPDWLHADQDALQEAARGPHPV